MDFLGGLISAGASIFNSAQNRSAQAQINDQNAQSNFNYATHSIDWKAGDAVQAEKDFGINRLVGMGASASSPPPVAVGVTDNNVASAGQDIGRAVAALSPVKLRAAELENQLLEAKIRNTDADTVSTMKTASDQSTKLGQPATAHAANVPYPTPDPRGPVLPLYSRFRDKDGTILELPSDKAASPLQTFATIPQNAAMAARDLWANTMGTLGTTYDNVTGAVGRAARDFNAAVYDRNTTGY